MIDALSKALKTLDRMDERLDAHGYLPTDDPRAEIADAVADLRKLMASAPQDVEEFIKEYGIKEEVWYGDVFAEERTYIDANDVRKFFSRSPSGCVNLQSFLDATAFIVGEPIGAGRFTNVVSERDLRAWMAGHARVPVEPTITNSMKADCIGEFFVQIQTECESCDGDGCLDCGHVGHFTRYEPIPWTTCKDIFKCMYKAMITASKESESTAASQQEGV